MSSERSEIPRLRVTVIVSEFSIFFEVVWYLFHVSMHSHSFGALFSLHEQVVHGDLALDVVGVASGVDTKGGDHRQVDGFLGALLT